MERLTGEIVGPYGPHINSSGVDCIMPKGEVPNLLKKIKSRGVEALVTQNPEKQSWQKYSLSGIAVTFTPSTATDRHGIEYLIATNVDLAKKVITSALQQPLPPKVDALAQT